MVTWNVQLRELRRGRSLSTSDLSSLSGISQASIHSYELDRRRPTRERLCRLLDSLAADTLTRNVILTDAGFASAIVGRYAEPNLSEEKCVQFLHRQPWPAFLVNHRADVLAVNEVAGQFLGLSRARVGARRPSILTFATRRAMATKCVNWDAAIVVMIRGFKAGNPREESLDAPGPSFAPLVEAVCAGDPALVGKFTELWNTMPAWKGPFTGVLYETIWKAGGHDRVQFHCVINCVNADAGFYIHTWIPADSKSFLLLEKLLADPAKTR
jgi:transcriptional regulator with XRE-family HTH domain